jgi:hypothetical protein
VCTSVRPRVAVAPYDPLRTRPPSAALISRLWRGSRPRRPPGNFLGVCANASTRPSREDSSTDGTQRCVSCGPSSRPKEWVGAPTGKAANLPRVVTTVLARWSEPWIGRDTSAPATQAALVHRVRPRRPAEPVVTEEREPRARSFPVKGRSECALRRGGSQRRARQSGPRVWGSIPSLESVDISTDSGAGNTDHRRCARAPDPPVAWRNGDGSSRVATYDDGYSLALLGPEGRVGSPSALPKQ